MVVVAYLLSCFVSSLQSIFVITAPVPRALKIPCWSYLVWRGSGAGQRAVLGALRALGILWDAVYFGFYSNHFNKPEQRNEKNEPKKQNFH